MKPTRARVNLGFPIAVWFPSLQGLSPEVASSSGVAAHVEHLRWSLALVNAMFRGERPNPDWQQSWTVYTVNESQWQEVQLQLHLEVQTLLSSIPANPAM